MKKIVLFCVTTVLVLFNCGTKPNQYILTKLDIVGANALFLGDKKGVSFSSSSSNDESFDLYKQADNYIEIVEQTWVNANTWKEDPYAPTQVPGFLQKFNDRYIFVMCNSGGSPDNPNYMVDTQTGNAYVFPINAMVELNDFQSMYRGANFWTDKYGYIYFPGRIGEGEFYADWFNYICKFDAGDLDNLTVKAASLKTPWYPYGGTYAVDKEGNCYYEGMIGKKPEDPHSSAYVVTNTGASYKIDEAVSSLEPIYHRFWQGYDGNVYDYAKKEKSSDKYWLVQWEIIDGDTLKAEPIYIKEFDYVDPFFPSYFLYLDDYEKVYSFSFKEDGDGETTYCLVELLNNKKQEKQEKYPLNVIDLPSYGSFYASSNFIYMLSDSKIFKINPENNTIDTVPIVDFSGQYQVELKENVHVKKNNLITLELKRLSDQRIVVGTVNAGDQNPELVVSDNIVFNDAIKGMISI